MPFLLQGISLSQGLNPGILRCRQILNHLSHQGSPASLYTSGMGTIPAFRARVKWAQETCIDQTVVLQPLATSLEKLPKRGSQVDKRLGAEG